VKCRNARAVQGPTCLRHNVRASSKLCLSVPGQSRPDLVPTDNCYPVFNSQWTTTTIGSLPSAGGGAKRVGCAARPPGRGEMGEEEKASMPLPRIGTPAPGFTLDTTGGAKISLVDYRGVKSVVLWFSKGLF